MQPKCANAIAYMGANGCDCKYKETVWKGTTNTSLMRDVDCQKGSGDERRTICFWHIRVATCMVVGCLLNLVCTFSAYFLRTCKA